VVFGFARAFPVNPRILGKLCQSCPNRKNLGLRVSTLLLFLLSSSGLNIWVDRRSEIMTFQPGIVVTVGLTRSTGV
jgi:hypothetical protein